MASIRSTLVLTLSISQLFSPFSMKQTFANNMSPIDFPCRGCIERPNPNEVAKHNWKPITSKQTALFTMPVEVRFYQNVQSINPRVFGVKKIFDTVAQVSFKVDLEETLTIETRSGSPKLNISRRFIPKYYPKYIARSGRGGDDSIKTYYGSIEELNKEGGWFRGKGYDFGIEPINLPFNLDQPMLMPLQFLGELGGPIKPKENEKNVEDKNKSKMHEISNTEYSRPNFDQKEIAKELLPYNPELKGETGLHAYRTNIKPNKAEEVLSPFRESFLNQTEDKTIGASFKPVKIWMNLEETLLFITGKNDRNEEAILARFERADNHFEVKGAGTFSNSVFTEMQSVINACDGIWPEDPSRSRVIPKDLMEIFLPGLNPESLSEEKLSAQVDSVFKKTGRRPLMVRERYERIYKPIRTTAERIVALGKQGLDQRNEDVEQAFEYLFFFLGQVVNEDIALDTKPPLVYRDLVGGIIAHVKHANQLAYGRDPDRMLGDKTLPIAAAHFHETIKRSIISVGLAEEHVAGSGENTIQYTIKNKITVTNSEIPQESRGEISDEDRRAIAASLFHMRRDASTAATSTGSDVSALDSVDRIIDNYSEVLGKQTSNLMKLGMSPQQISDVYRGVRALSNVRNTSDKLPPAPFSEGRGQ